MKELTAWLSTPRLLTRCCGAPSANFDGHVMLVHRAIAILQSIAFHSADVAADVAAFSNLVWLTAGIWSMKATWQFHYYRLP